MHRSPPGPSGRASAASSGLRSEGVVSKAGKSANAQGATYSVGKTRGVGQKGVLDGNNNQGYQVDDGCGTCRKVIGGGQRAISCNGCEGWYHIMCVGMEKKDYDYHAARGEASVWVCNECLKGMRDANGRIAKLEIENESLRKQNREIVGKLESLMDRMKDMRESIVNQVKEELMVDMREMRESLVKRVKEEAMIGLDTGVMKDNIVKQVKNEVIEVVDIREGLVNHVKQFKREVKEVIDGVNESVSVSL